MANKVVRIEQLNSYKEVCQYHADRIEARIEQKAFGWYGVPLPENVQAEFDALRAEQKDFLKGVEEAQAEIDKYCLPLLKVVGEFLHDALCEKFPITSKTAVVKLQREWLGYDKTSRYAIPRQQPLVIADSPSPYMPPPEIVTVHFTPWAATADSYRFAVGYEASIDTIFVA